MRLTGVSIILTLCVLPLEAQDQPADTNQGAAAIGILGDGFGDMPNMPEMPKSIRVSNDGKLEFDYKKGTYLFEGKVEVSGNNGLILKAQKALIKAKEEEAILTGNTSVRQATTKDDTGRIIPGIQIFADKLHLNAKTKIVTLDGNVSIYQGPTLQRGQHAVYNYETKKLHTQGLASKIGPFVMESDHFEMVEHKGKPAFIGKNAGITTHDVENPNYWIRSKQTTIYPNDRIIFKNMQIFAGDTPIFWFPYLSQSLDQDLGLHIIPGGKTTWGTYLLSSYGIMLGGDRDEETGERENAWLLSKWNLDIRTKRGIGGGVDLYDTRLDDNENLGWLKLYYLNDQNPTLQRTDEPRGFVDPNRWKIELKHRIEFQRNAEGSTYADFNITALSDRYFLEDFEPGVYKINPNPINEAGIFHRNEKYLAGIYTRLRLNDFYQSDTRLPELFLDQIKGPLLGSPILHEGQTTLGVYKDYLSDFEVDELRTTAASLPPNDSQLNSINDLLDQNAFSRFHTWHEFSLPLNLDGKITIVPKAGAGVTSYWDISDNKESVTRTHLSAGVDASMKFSKVYPNAQSQFWGLDGLLHVIQPYANFYQLATSHYDDTFPGIETLVPSTRPPLREPGRFPATDDLASWTVLRLGGRNILLSKRDGDTHRWLAMDTYIDVFFNDPESDRALSNLYNDLTWQPLPWMKLDLETQFPIANNRSNFSELATYLTFMPNSTMEMQLGYRLLNNHPTLQDSSRINLRTHLRLNDSWGVGTYHRFELDDNTLEVQQYTVNRDFDSWRTSLGFLIRDNRESKDEYALMLNFTLKNFPALRLPLSIDAE